MALVVTMQDSNRDDYSKVTYENADGKYITFFQSNSNASSTIQVDTENAQTIQSIQINDSEALLVCKDGISTIVWSIGDSLLHLTSNYNADILIAIAENIKLIK